MEDLRGEGFPTELLMIMEQQLRAGFASAEAHYTGTAHILSQASPVAALTSACLGLTRSGACRCDSLSGSP